MPVKNKNKPSKKAKLLREIAKALKEAIAIRDDKLKGHSLDYLLNGK